MRARLLVCAALIASALIWPAGASAQDTGFVELGTITGLTLTNEAPSDQPCILIFPPPPGCGPQPLAGVRVTVIPDAQVEPLSAVSDSSGRYTITNVPLGSSTVRATPPSGSQFPTFFGSGLLPAGCNADSTDGPMAKTVSVDFGQTVEINWFCPSSRSGIPGFPSFPGLPSFPGFPPFSNFLPFPFLPLPVDFGGGIA